MRKRKITFYVLTPIILTFAILLLSATRIFDLTESLAYDLLLASKPPAQPDKSILLVDTTELRAKGDCTRIGESLVLAKELGLRAALLNTTTAETCDTFDRYIALFGNSYIPIRMDKRELIRKKPEPTINSHIIASTMKVNIASGDIYTTEGAIMPPESLLVAAKGTGFIIQADASGRTTSGIPLIVQYKDLFVPELGFATALGIMGIGDIVIDNDALVLTATRQIAGKTRETRLPLTGDGGFPLNLSSNRLESDFRRISCKELIDYDENVEKLYAGLVALGDLGYLSYYQRTKEVFEAYKASKSFRDSLEHGPAGITIGDEDFEKYKAQGEIFLDETDKLLKSSTEDANTSFIIRKSRSAQAGAEALKDVAARFAEARRIFAGLEKERIALKKALSDSIAVYSDIPNTSDEAPPVPAGTKRWDGLLSAGILSTILSEKYVTIFPFWYGYIAALILSLAAAFIMRKLSFVPALIAGFSIVVFYVLVDAAIFVLGRYYIHCTAESSIMIATTIAVAAIDLIRRKTDLFFMRASVSGKLSPQAINEIVTKPERVHAEGEKKIVTVLASEVKAFSLIASKIDSGNLIEVIRQYHSEMGGAILNQSGTIEKHDQDTTLAFFGSPLEVPDHARKGCIAALHIKKLEHSLNKHFLGSKLSPLPFLSRIGIATGEVITGNIGNDLLPDFAILGFAPALAKQLATVNALYGTSVIITDSTFKEVRADFTVRQLDRVRIGRSPAPIRIYELIEEKDATPPQLVEMLELYHDALYLFEKREWHKSFLRFQKTLSIVSGDKPSKVYLNRCKAYIKQPPFQNWDGVFKVSGG